MKNIFLLFAVLFLQNFCCFGQLKIIKGTVYNEKGMPLNHANVIGANKNGNRFVVGTYTDENGKFSLVIPKNNVDLILCSSIGYENKNESIEGNDSINFILKSKVRRDFIFLKEESRETIVRKIWAKPKKSKKTQKVKDQQPKIIHPPVFEEDAIFTKVELQAVFAGGNDKLKRYFEKAIIYPNIDTLQNAVGSVVAGFTIDKNGYAKNITIIKSVNIFANEAVINAIKKMPKWAPAIQNGVSIDQYFEFSFEFNIKNIVTVIDDGKPSN